MGYGLRRWAIWTAVASGGGQAAPMVVREEDTRWVNGELTADGLQPLPLVRLANEAHARGLIVGAVVHTFNRWQWAEADFEINGDHGARCR